MAVGLRTTIATATRLLSGCLPAMLMLALTSFAQGDEPPVSPLGQLTGHEHRPIHVRSQPVIERLPLHVMAPSDLSVGAAGVLFVADPAAECVFRVDRDAATSLVVSEERGIRRIVADESNSLYLLTEQSGTSIVSQVSADGLTVRLASLPFAANGLTRTATGRLYVGNAQGRVTQIASDGVVQAHADCASAIQDLCVSSAGQLYAMLDSREIVLITEDGRVRAAGRAQPQAIRVFSLPAGRLATLSPQPGDRPLIAEVAMGEDREFAEYARVPSGTVAVAFDHLGNLSLANPRLRAITRVTSHFQVPCPHCGQPVPLHLSPDAGPAPQRQRF